MWRLQAIDPGFTAPGGVTLNIELAGPRYARQRRHARHSGSACQIAPAKCRVSTAVGLGVNVPPDDPDDVNNFDLIDIPARGGAEPTAPWNNVTPGFLDALGVRLLEGRNFTARGIRLRIDDGARQ